MSDSIANTVLLNQQPVIGIIGLGYVGLPLAVAFSGRYETIGYDINETRISELKAGKDVTDEITSDQLMDGKNSLTISQSKKDLSQVNVFIITVPTPIDKNNLPDLEPLIEATKTVGTLLKKNDIVVYESTVFPGATEQLCTPILQETSGLSLNKEFYIAYSPERINPGDKNHTLKNITKVLAASEKEVAVYLKNIYLTIIDNVYLAESIQVAEAAKAIENTQRDINIAFMNELSMMFHAMGIDTQEVLKAAATKWNFLPFYPGLVGGHCIGVDPYYLIHKSQECGYFPELITRARQLNENMSEHITARILKMLALNKTHIVGAKILILGVTFKENCPDLRNTKVIPIIHQLKKYHAHVDVFDPWAKQTHQKDAAQINLVKKPNDNYQMIVIAVAHQIFIDMGVERIRKLLGPDGLLFDLKSVFEKYQVDARL